ncbi:MAG: response regulator transcription factor [Ktedonobacterales bacterium]|nr:response regulator transcription factor [Ktedonobacterales bacterium]
MAEPQSIRIMIVDDQMLLRQGFRRLLELEGGGLQVIATANNGAEALTTVARLTQEGTPPDVILMDVSMPVMTGVEATAKIHQQWPQIGILILTTFDDEQNIIEGLSAGAKGYLLKDVSLEELVAAIRAVQRGESPIQPSVAAKLVQRMARDASTTADATRPTTPGPRSMDQVMYDDLTEREREILRYLGHGASNREISEQLFITEGTVKNHVSNVLSKLGLRDRTQAAIYAREHGLK